MKTTEQKNRMIAEFIGDLNNIDSNVSFTKSCAPKNFRYHNSWDWLMPVVIYINVNTEHTFVIQAMDCYVYNVNNGEQVTQPSMKHQPSELINSVYETVVEFIEWYNENK